MAGAAGTAAAAAAPAFGEGWVAEAVEAGGGALVTLRPDGGGGGEEEHAGRPPVAYAWVDETDEADEADGRADAAAAAGATTGGAWVETVSPMGRLRLRRDEFAAAYRAAPSVEAARGAWVGFVARGARLAPSERVYLLCGPVQPYLPRLQKRLGGRPPVRRATLASGHECVGLLVERAVLADVLRGGDDEAPATTAWAASASAPWAAAAAAAAVRPRRRWSSRRHRRRQRHRGAHWRGHAQRRPQPLGGAAGGVTAAA